MKKNILLTVVSFAAILARAQSFHYYPLKEVGDTIEYLKLNFDKQADYFVGRTFDEFWQIIRRDITPKLLNIKDTSPFVDPHGVRMWRVWILVVCRPIRIGHQLLISECILSRHLRSMQIGCFINSQKI